MQKYVLEEKKKAWCNTDCTYREKQCMGPEVAESMKPVKKCVDACNKESSDDDELEDELEDELLLNFRLDLLRLGCSPSLLSRADPPLLA